MEVVKINWYTTLEYMLVALISTLKADHTYRSTV